MRVSRGRDESWGDYASRVARSVRFRAAHLVGMSADQRERRFRGRVDRLITRLAPVATEFPLIRVGPATGDGGYLVPDDLDGIVHAISPGVGPVVGFDLDLVERGIPVTMLDATVSGPPVEHPSFDFRPLFLDDHVSAATTTLDALVAESGPGDLFLEMDIEGAEWRVLATVSRATLSRFRVMVIEFHGLTRLNSAEGYREVARVIEKLLATHRVAHFHFNNAAEPKRIGTGRMSPVFELTFHRADRGTARGRSPMPHELDSPNLPERPEAPIPPALSA